MRVDGFSEAQINEMFARHWDELALKEAKSLIEEYGFFDQDLFDRMKEEGYQDEQIEMISKNVEDICQEMNRSLSVEEIQDLVDGCFGICANASKYRIFSHARPIFHGARYDRLECACASQGKAHSYVCGMFKSTVKRYADQRRI